MKETPVSKTETTTRSWVNYTCEVCGNVSSVRKHIEDCEAKHVQDKRKSECDHVWAYDIDIDHYDHTIDIERFCGKCCSRETKPMDEDLEWPQEILKEIFEAV